VLTPSEHVTADISMLILMKL